MIYTETMGNVFWKDINNDKILIFIKDDVKKSKDPKDLDVTKYHVIGKALTRIGEPNMDQESDDPVILKDSEFLEALKTLFPEQPVNESMGPSSSPERKSEDGDEIEKTKDPKSAAMCIFILFILIIVYIMWCRNAL